MRIRAIRGREIKNIKMKTVKAVAPYIHPGHLNFKTAPYEAWIAEDCQGTISLAITPFIGIQIRTAIIMEMRQGGTTAFRRTSITVL